MNYSISTATSQQRQSGSLITTIALVLALTFGFKPAQAHADSDEAIAALLIGASLLFAAHEVHDDYDDYDEYYESYHRHSHREYRHKKHKKHKHRHRHARGHGHDDCDDDWYDDD
ncbi:ABC-type nickel/cobalt efflux system permease component RcnA [Litorivivens lipolytica]|uniref:ABC-type nickel/cobalt efflux system permease component RcnA n=1 Tax=Litorivivens lipolytica TaxID=1524264 RepID=A0A7W4W693_9GAMM|nr:hypothetical protein [Litorivivens lipolytica]MBB3048231.1 ABC-type nickel/cobalt efflux system permease component RcnA [Litorivivens lipolytica]